MEDETETLFAEIDALLEAPNRGESAPTRSAYDHTLTAGYARALALEAERWRIERRISEVGSELTAGSNGRGEELSALARRLSGAEAELIRLRSRLSSLRTKAAKAPASASTA